SANLGPDGVRQATGVVLVEAPGGGGPIGRFEPAQIAGGLDEDHEQRRDVGQIDGGFELGSGQGVRHRQNRTGSPSRNRLTASRWYSDVCDTVSMARLPRIVSSPRVRIWWLMRALAACSVRAGPAARRA